MQRGDGADAVIRRLLSAIAVGTVCAAGIALAALVPPALPPAFTGSTALFKLGYGGCSNTQSDVEGYHYLAMTGGMGHQWLWEPDAGTYSGVTAPGYNTGGLDVFTWGVPDTPPGGTSPWILFQAQITAFGQPDAVWLGICEQHKTNPSTNFAMLQQWFATLKNFVTTRKFYISVVPDYPDPTSACVSREMFYAVADTKRYVQAAISTGLALPGPVLKPLEKNDRISDDCHPRIAAASNTTTLAADAAQGATSVTLSAIGSLQVGQSLGFNQCGLTGSFYTEIASVAGNVAGLKAAMPKLCASGTLVTAHAQALQLHDFFDHIGTTP